MKKTSPFDELVKVSKRWAEQEQKRTRYSILILTGVIAVIELIMMGIVDPERLGVVPALWHRVTVFRCASAGVALIVFLITLKRGHVMRRSTLSVLGVCVVVSVFPMAWVAQSAFLLSGRLYLPLALQKLGFLCFAALIVGYYWVNAIILLALWLEYLLFWHFHRAAMQELISSMIEPWSTIMFFLAGVAIFVFNYRSHKSWHRLAYMKAGIAAYRYMAEVSISVRDLTNSPLQTLECGVELLQRHVRPVDPLLAEIHDRMRRALGRLKRLSFTLSSFECYGDEETSAVLDEQQLLLRIHEDGLLLKQELSHLRESL